MGLYRVIRVVDLEAGSELEALAVSATMHPVEERVIELERPRPTDSTTWVYEQSRDVLNLAWDLFMDRSLPRELQGLEGRPVGQQLPTLAGLCTRGLEVHELSALFDVAITAYRNRAE
jgi:hypothetical protein